MSKKHFIKLADYIRDWQNTNDKFTDSQLSQLARFCADVNPRFNTGRWFAYIRGECGPNGGAVNKAKI